LRREINDFSLKFDLPLSEGDSLRGPQAVARIEQSQGLETALYRARCQAAAEGVDALTPAHLFQGLLADEDSLPYRLLVESGINPGALIAPALSPEREETVADLPVEPKVRAILNLARRAVPWHSAEGTVTTDLVLLALLELDETIRAQLIRLGLDWENWQTTHPLQAPSLALDEPLHLDEGPASPDLARLLDASGNRAREALRVLEDYTRFVLDDAFLTRQLKSLRHDLVEALAPFSTSFLHARATLDDVGVSLSTPQEHERASLEHVVRANAKRLQEALRSLEEFGKVHSPALGQALERLRYQSYTLERALALGAQARERLAKARLYVLLTEKMCALSWIGTLREVLEGGADVIQLREKDLDDRALLERAREARRLTREYDILFIINDRPDIALLCDADGVHLGQDDLPVRDALRFLGADALIGVSTHDLDQVRQAVLEGATYLGVGPTFPSHTKVFHALAGLEFVRAAHDETTLPAFALGGVTLDNLDRVLQAGARRVAVSHAICAAPDPQAATREFKRRLSE